MLCLTIRLKIYIKIHKEKKKSKKKYIKERGKNTKLLGRVDVARKPIRLLGHNDCAGQRDAFIATTLLPFFLVFFSLAFLPIHESPYPPVYFPPFSSHFLSAPHSMKGSGFQRTYQLPFLAPTLLLPAFPFSFRSLPPLSFSFSLPQWPTFILNVFPVHRVLSLILHQGTGTANG